jgi:glutamine synthetase
MYYIGGLLKHIRALTAVSSPIINCYRRIQSGEFVYSSASGYTWTPSFRILWRQ